MSKFRFEIGDRVMCNLGSAGWKLGRIIATDYREPTWTPDQTAPYQVMLESDHMLIYVPEDVDDYCRIATQEDLKILSRTDALAMLPEELESPSESPRKISSNLRLGCDDQESQLEFFGYRNGRCHGCDCCPRNWRNVEFYSEHYRCVERNELKVTRQAVDLGSVRVGDSVNHRANQGPLSDAGFMQCPMLVRLPPGLKFSDDGSLIGNVHFDPHRSMEYEVDFVAVSTDRWDDPDVGIVRLEIKMKVGGNEPPVDFDLIEFQKQQARARESANECYDKLGSQWNRWELGESNNSETCKRMGAELGRLRQILEQNPRLDRGWWWAQLGGYHMNIHKLLENTLLECEIYLGHALTFGDSEVRWLAEQNLKGCYKKRLLEAARFLWIAGLKQMLEGQWDLAAKTLQRAASKSDGWGWAINFGDIWFTESAARLIHGVQLKLEESTDATVLNGSASTWIAESKELLDRGVARTGEADYFGSEGHPWAVEIAAAVDSFEQLGKDEGQTIQWLQSFKSRTAYWCAQVLGGAYPFPPPIRPRSENAADLVERLLKHNDF
ncbi:MAG: hypothetical protein AAF623_07780 [Planctomycetota bacterium]